MRIVFTMRIVAENDHTEIRDAISHDWITWAEKEKIFPVLLSNRTSNIDDFFHGLDVDAVILTGGNDVVSSGKKIDNYSAQRNSFESRVVDYAILNSIPIFAVCRGFHLINKYFGGVVQPNILDYIGETEKHVAVEHEVVLVNRFKDIFTMDTIVTNSYHNQGVFENDLADPLVSFANCYPSGIVEGYYHKELPIVGLQWHPERKTQSEVFDRSLLNMLVKEKTFWRSGA